jgi:hypothetical protein
MNVDRIRLLHRAACAAMVLAALAPTDRAAAAEDLGRLFFTPQQRQELDRRRQANLQDAAAISVDSTVTINGHLSRSSGKSTTWVNGVPRHDSHRTRDPARVVVGGNEGEAPTDLKIGQTLDKTRGEVKDGLGGGRIIIRRGKND